MAKITFGTGGMLDLVVGDRRVRRSTPRGDGGTFPIVAWRRDGNVTWGVEAVMLSAGTNVEWLRDDLGLIDSAEASRRRRRAVRRHRRRRVRARAARTRHTGWDYGARGTLLGITRGTERTHVVRAVLEGVANRGADLIEAAEADGGMQLPAIRIDGGMAANHTFVQALADASQRSDRGVTGARSDDPRRRLPRRARDRARGRRTTTSWRPGSRRASCSLRFVRPRPLARRVPARRRAGFPSSRRSTSDMARLEPIRTLVPDARNAALSPFDTDYAAFAESLELAMVALYNDTLLKLTGENVATAARFRDHHQDARAGLRLARSRQGQRRAEQHA